MKKFNITGVCILEKHYMVDLENKLGEIIDLIEDEEYFTINRARQFGKTTIINQLYHALKNKYLVLQLSFEGVGDVAFSSENEFCESFINLVSDELKFNNVDIRIISKWEENKSVIDKFEDLSIKITQLTNNIQQEILLMIDEVDKSSNNQLFLNFIGMLRNKYLKRNSGRDTTFKSVILVGVYDIKNLKLKLCPDDEKKYNSPWNIAANFTVDMSFSPNEIATMLLQYEKDANTGMNIAEISQLIYDFTSGYPFLVSRLCKEIDEALNKNWTISGVDEAVKTLLLEQNTLFDDMIKNLENNGEMYKVIYGLIIEGKEFSFNLGNPVLTLLHMFSIIARSGEKIKIHNQIFEKYLYAYLISKTETSGMKIVNYSKNQFFDTQGNLLMERVMNKFQELMQEEYRQKDQDFIEREGRLIFLAFMKPIINGESFYFVEPQTRNNSRMDIIITINKKQYIIELKKWYGKEYEERGYSQLARYLEIKKEQEGYMVMFDFRKENKEYTKRWLQVDGEKIYEVVV